jgi:hypothetical protein
MSFAAINQRLMQDDEFMIAAEFDESRPGSMQKFDAL